MKKFIALPLALLAAPAFAADIENGADLHFTNCTGCHDESVYTRADRSVQSLDRLEKQVRFCKNSLELVWFDEDVADVVEYLNENYYHF
ncbi:MAG: cytochrome c [Gammaproteobacteria bacterium]|jgi:hypothetical protein